jgi:hypothetical protein
MALIEANGKGGRWPNGSVPFRGKTTIVSVRHFGGQTRLMIAKSWKPGPGTVDILARPYTISHNLTIGAFHVILKLNFSSP